MRIRRGPATVTGEQSPTTEVTVHASGLEGRGYCGSGSQETLVAVTSNQGADPE